MRDDGVRERSLGPKLTIKPHLGCIGQCYFCDPRSSYYRLLRAGDSSTLSPEEWHSVLQQAKDLACAEVCISGGEPMLYRRLPDLVRVITGLGFSASINTTGTTLAGSAEELVGAGLTYYGLSLYSASASIHDSVKQRPGLWRQAVAAAERLVSLREKEDPRVTVTLYFLLLRENHRELGAFLRFAREVGVDNVFVSYLQGYFTSSDVYLQPAEIELFRRQALPEAIDFLHEVGAASELIAQVASLYGPERTLAEYARGTYIEAALCAAPSRSHIILANGDVHGCNMVELAHAEALGNVRRTSLRETLSDAEIAGLTDSALCRHCSVPRNVMIPLSTYA